MLVGVQLPGVDAVEHAASMAELGRLVDTLGYAVVGQVTQRREGLAPGASVELRLDAAPASATESGEHADTVTFVHVPNRRLLQTELHVTRRVADRPSGSERPS